MALFASSLCFCFVIWLLLSSLYQDMQFESYAASARPPLLPASRIMAMYLGARSASSLIVIVINFTSYIK